MTSSDVARLVFGYLSDRGLEETKNAFSKESQDLLGSRLDIDGKGGRKLTSIIEEYFQLKGCDKKGKPTDPENVLSSLWKQFDVLVGQLKHSTIHNSAKDKIKAKRDFRDQKARVRELNKQNWVALQQKNKSIAATQRGILPKHGVVCATINSPQCSPSINTQYIHIGSYTSVPQPAHLLQNVSSSSVVRAPVWKTPPKIPHTTAGVVQNDVISQSVLNSSQPLQSSHQHLAPRHQLKSPKRKSVPPKKRNGETVAEIPPAQASVKSTPFTSTPTSTQEDNQLDIQSIVDKILGRPELPEKLAENINRAVEIDVVPGQQSGFDTEAENHGQAQAAVVNSNKVNDIMEMMKSDPVFEELFSSFENFESSCEESEAGQVKGNDPETPKPSNSLDQDQCANEALDALLLLANSPVRTALQTSDFFETPQKGKTSSALSSDAAHCRSSVPDVVSPGDSNPMRPLPHVRQLNFGRTSETSGDGNTSQGANSGDTVLQSIESSNSDGKSSDGKCLEVISKREVFKGDDSCREDVVFVGSKAPSVKPTYQSCSPHKTRHENAEASIDKQGNVGQEKGVADHPVVFESEAEKSSPVGAECQEEKTTEIEDIVCSSNGARTRKIDNTEKPCGRNKKINESPLKLSVLEDLAVNEFLQKKTVEPEATSPSKASHRKCTLMKDVNEEECNRTDDVVLRESTEPENISTKSKDTTSTEVSEGLTSLTEEFVSYIGGFTNIKTPESKKIPGNDSSTESDKSSKRKLKRKKKSTRTSKKAKVIPEDLDVDKFLSGLHYVHEEKT